ncbi:hypothetical protein Ahy_A07g034546 [Arachis hypogaea]|uniref:CCHC-type domain-containing protein n=1 Tax=Arachis hypogaea TaxID=3818 RepID=A0A445CC53_ARAHY|nr:hypothetical protein Ahy_A07g034546 [Arachis hypogaea]
MWIFKRSALLFSRNKPLPLSLQNPSSSLYPDGGSSDDFCISPWGKFKKDEGGYLYYEPDHTEVLMGVEADTLDVFFVRGYYVELGYAEARECWWKSPGVPLEYGLRRLATDDDLVAMVKDCRRNFNLINLYFEHGVSEPCVVDEQEGDVPKINPTQTKRHQSQPTKLPSHQKASSESTKASAEGSRLSQPSKLPSQSKKFSTKSTKEPSQPSKLPTQPTKQPMQPTKEPTKPTGPSLKPTGPSTKPTRPTTKPSRPSSQPTKKSHEPMQTSSQQRKAYSQPTKPTPATTQPKGKAKVTTTTRAGRHVKAIEVEEDSDSHDSYESAEDSLYKPPRVLGDDESSSDSDDGVNSTRLNKKREVKEKHKPAKTRLAEKEIETDDSSYEASESEDESDSGIWLNQLPKPGRPTKKRRKDKGEQPVGSSTKMKRKYNPIRCMFCGEVGHNKRSCAKKKKEDAEDQARQMQLQVALPNGPAPLTDDPNTNNEVQSHSFPPPPVQPEPAVEVNQPVQDTQLPVQDIQGEKRGRPPKLHVIKKKARSNASTQSPVAISAETLKGTTSATAKKMQTFMTFVPTPGFKRPRKKD